MKTIHVRNLPNDLYKRLWKLARVNHQSLSEQVITLLSKAIGEERRNKQVYILNSIQSRRFKIPANAPSSLELLQEDRGR
jgi:plasmid stability protein